MALWNLIFMEPKPWLYLLISNQKSLDQLYSVAYRIEKNGLKNSLVFDRLQHIKLEIENIK